MPKPIRVKSEAEFELLLDDIGMEASRAAERWHLLRGLDAAIDEFHKELRQSPAFWNTMLRTLYEVVLSYLGRLYDQHGTALSLGSFLATVKANPDYFSEQSFRQRLRSSPHVEELAADMRRLDVSMLEEEIRSVSPSSNPLVRRLVNLRNKTVAHRDASVVRLAKLASLSGFSPEEIDCLLATATETVNRYSRLYKANVLSDRVIGADDYKHMLKLLRIGRESDLAEREEDIRRMEELKTTSAP